MTVLDNHAECLTELNKTSDKVFQLEAAIKAIKSLVIGDRAPHWIEDNWTITATRGTIADICDNALGIGGGQTRYGWR